MRIRISHLVNSLTRQALYETVPGYVPKEADFAALEEDARRNYGIERLHRFDLGENSEGSSPRVMEYLRSLETRDLASLLSGYPETAAPLKNALAGLHDVPAEWIALGTGVVSFISILCHTFYEWGDRVVLPTPTFFVIEEYILRSGALPIYMPFSHEEGFAWTPRMTAQVIHQMQCVPTKMLWLCSPNNPTGQAIPADDVEEMVRAAEETFTMVVVDEAYGEFTDDRPNFVTATRLLPRYENLIVLRSFSKAYGLAGMRVGFAMMSSRVVHDAVARQMEYFPITKLSLDLARIAAEDRAYIASTRLHTRERLGCLRETLSAIERVETLPSETNVFLCRVRGLNSAQARDGLLGHGILVATADIEGLRDQGWVRVTCRTPDENTLLVDALESVGKAGEHRCGETVC